jgi:hypothetical protein
MTTKITTDLGDWIIYHVSEAGSPSADDKEDEMADENANTDISTTDLDEAPSPQQIQAWVTQAALTGKRKIVKVRGEVFIEIG